MTHYKQESTDAAAPAFRPAIIYVRVSSKKQAKEGGLKSQETTCRQYAKMRGLTVIEVFKDDVTGKIANRTGMKDTLAFLRKNRKAQPVVIVDAISRIARTMKAHLKITEDVIRAGGTLESPNDTFGTDSDSIFREHMSALLAQHEAHKNGERTIQRMRARLTDGYYVNAIPPLGYVYKKVRGQGNCLFPQEPYATIVREALEGFASGRLGSQGEVRCFLASHPEFPTNKKGEVTHQRARVLLNHLVYAGMIEGEAWGVSLRHGKHEGLISYETFLKIQNKLSEGAKIVTRIDIDQDFVLRGAVSCADCTKPLTASWSKGQNKKYPYYHCFNKSCDSYKISIPRDRMENHFETLLAQLQPSQTLFKAASRMFKDLWDYQGHVAQSRIKGLQDDLLKLDADLAKKLERMFDTENETIIAAIETRINNIEKEKLAITETIKKLGKPVRPFKTMFEQALTFLANPYSIWQNGNFEDRKMVLKLAFSDRLSYSRNGGFRTPKTSQPFQIIQRLSDGVKGDFSSEKVMARRGRFELPTPRFVVWCSIQLSYRRVFQTKVLKRRGT